MHSRYATRSLHDALGGIGMLAFGLGFVGCTTGRTLERQEVQAVFRDQFGCATPTLKKSLDAYRVVGCGVEAEFTCVDQNALRRIELEQDEHARETRKESGREAPVLDAIGSILDANESLRMHDTCTLDRTSVERLSDGQVLTPAHGRVPSVSTSALFGGGYSRWLGVPAANSTHVRALIHTVTTLTVAPCAVKLFVDGVPVPASGLKVAGPNEVQFSVPVESLRGVHRAVRVGGEVCGIDVQFDAEAREVLAQFAARFSEVHVLAAKAAPATSGGEAAGSTKSQVPSETSTTVE